MLNENASQSKRNQWLNIDEKQKNIFSAEYDRILANLDMQTSLDNFEKCDMIIEAVYEDLGLKQKVLAELEQRIPEHCVFASNTSALPIHLIAEKSRRPDKVFRPCFVFFNELNLQSFRLGYWNALLFTS